MLFGPGEDWQANACIARWHQAPGYYASGFRLAGFRLADHVCANGSEQDTLIYPIVYLYRHHVELVLKDIIRTAAWLLDRELSNEAEKALNGHGLSTLWNIAKPMLQPVCESADNPPFPVADIEGINSYIAQLDKHDPDGQRFRYATIRKAKPGSNHSLAPELKHVNIRQFAEAMEKLADHLEAVAGWFGDLSETKAEMESWACG